MSKCACACVRERVRGWVKKGNSSTVAGFHNFSFKNLLHSKLFMASWKIFLPTPTTKDRIEVKVNSLSSRTEKYYLLLILLIQKL